MSRHILHSLIWAAGLALVWADPVLAEPSEPQTSLADAGEPDHLSAGSVLQAWICNDCTVPVCVSVRAFDGDLHLLLYRPSALPSILTTEPGGDLKFCQPDMRRIEIACISRDTCNFTLKIQEFDKLDLKTPEHPIDWSSPPLTPRT